MRRNVAHIATSLWRDRLFMSLNYSEQWLYFALRLAPNLNNGAMLPYTPRRWSNLAPDVTVDDIPKWLNALAASHLVEVDYDADEVFVSGFFASEFIASQPRRAAGAYDAINESFSHRLRAVALAELADAVAAAADRVPTGIRAVVLERDGYQCKACGWRPGDVAPAGAPGSEVYRGLEVDHIYPRSRGGGDELSNLQVLCSICNTKKGARV